MKGIIALISWAFRKLFEGTAIEQIIIALVVFAALLVGGYLLWDWWQRKSNKAPESELRRFSANLNDPPELATKITQLQDALDGGLLTQEEYELKKAQIRRSFSGKSLGEMLEKLAHVFGNRKGDHLRGAVAKEMGTTVSGLLVLELPRGNSDPRGREDDYGGPERDYSTGVFPQA